MAKRRLNKKVALVGSVVFLLAGLAVILVVLKLSRNPEKFIRDGEAALAAKDYKIAEASYKGAYARARTNALREEILFKLVDIYIATGQLNNLPSCWEQIIRLDPKNVKARFGFLMYIYIWADSGGGGVWQQVRDEASEFLEVAEEAQLMEEDASGWEIAGFVEGGGNRRGLGAFLYLVRGRALLEMTRRGEVTDQQESLSKAVDDFKAALALEPNNVDVYWYLAGSAVTRGEVFAQTGNFQERDNALSEAKALLEEGVKVAGSDPVAHINLLSLKLDLASRATEVEQELKVLEPEYMSLLERFPSESRVFSAAAQFYSFYSLNSGPDGGEQALGSAIKAAETAVSLEPSSVSNVIEAARLHYFGYCVYGRISHAGKVIELANKGLLLPGAEDVIGPRSLANRLRRRILQYLLANCYIGQILDPAAGGTDSERESLLASAEAAVHEIEQIYGSGENPEVVRWRGMLDLARGEGKAAVKKLYAAYEQRKAARPAEPRWVRDPEYADLSYTLARVFKDSSEVGAVAQFLTSSLTSYVSELRPQARLDYVETVLKFSRWSDAIENLDAFERRMGATERSRRLRVLTYIGAGQFEEAAKSLADRAADDPNTLELSLMLAQAKMGRIRLAIAARERQSGLDAIFGSNIAGDGTGEPNDSLEVMREELSSYVEVAAELIGRLLTMAPDMVKQTWLTGVYSNYVERGRIEEAIGLADRYLGHFTDDTAVLVYREFLKEGDPGQIPLERRNEIKLKVISGLSDRGKRSLQLGMLHRVNGDTAAAIAEFKKVLDTVPSAERSAGSRAFMKSEEDDPRRLAAGNLFDIATGEKNWTLAEEIAAQARSEDLDYCEGEVYAARLAVARGNFEEALRRIDEVLRQRPVFSRAYMLRSNINTALGNDIAATQDIQKAASLNPLDGTIAKGLAERLYVRNRNLGENVSSSQIVETRAALERAIRLNPRDFDLLGLYAAFVAPTDPLKAVAIMQEMHKSKPSLKNAVVLGQLATKTGVREADPKRKSALFAVAGSALSEGLKMDPENEMVRHSYAEYLRATGQYKLAEELLVQSKSDTLLWYHYFQQGRYDDARKILERLYEKEPQDANVVKGLLLVAEKTNDEAAVLKRSDELVSLAGISDNYLIQIQSFLRVGLVKEAELKLEAFTERFPAERRTLLLKAWLAMRQGQLTRALELTNEHLESGQENSAAWRLRGEIHFFMADYEQAANDLRRSKSLKDEPITRFTLAKAYYRMRRFEDAITELKNTVDAPGAPLEARSLLESIYLRLDHKASLKDLYDETLEKFPDSILWRNRAGEFAVNTGQFERAEQLFAEAYSAKSEEYRGQGSESWMGDSLYAGAVDGYLKSLILAAGAPGTASWNPRKLDKVFEESGKFTETPFAPIAYLRMAQARIKLGDKVSAVEYCRKAVDKAGANETLASEVLLRMFLMLGPDEVSNYCSEKLQEDPNSIAANFTMFNLAKINGRYNEAVKYIDICIELSPADSRRKVDYTAKKAEVLTLAYERSSDKTYLDQAIGDYKSLLEKMPKNTSVLNNLAYMLAEKNEGLPEALEYAERAVELRPNDAALLDTYGYVLYRNGNNSKAESVLLSALQQYEQKNVGAPAELYEHLGMVKEAVGDKTRALAAYRQALQVGADTLSARAKELLNAAIERVSRAGGGGGSAGN
ncbi:MAG: tetratricopeptide repeat protein [Phycisphaerales bacterium]|nr:MAG: tetratricopeptide repeat protein [Phycisphaerales bacterium]